MEAKAMRESCSGLRRIFSRTINEVIGSRKRPSSVSDKSSSFSLRTSSAKDEKIGFRERPQTRTWKHVDGAISCDSQDKPGDATTKQTDHCGNRAVVDSFGKRPIHNSYDPPNYKLKTKPGLHLRQSEKAPSASSVEEISAFAGFQSQDAASRTNNFSLEKPVNLDSLSQKRQSIKSCSTRPFPSTHDSVGSSETNSGFFTSAAPVFKKTFENQSGYEKWPRDNRKTVEATKVPTFKSDQETSSNDHSRLGAHLTCGKKANNHLTGSNQEVVIKTGKRSSISKVSSDFHMNSGHSTKSKSVSPSKSSGKVTLTSPSERKEATMCELQRCTMHIVQNDEKVQKFMPVGGKSIMKHTNSFNQGVRGKHWSPGKSQEVSNWRAVDSKKRDSNTRDASVKSLNFSVVTRKQCPEECQGPVTGAHRNLSAQSGLEFRVKKDAQTVGRRQCNTSGTFLKVGNQISLSAQLRKSTVVRSSNEEDWNKDCIDTTTLSFHSTPELDSKVKPDDGQSNKKVQHDTEATLLTYHSAKKEIKPEDENDFEGKEETATVLTELNIKAETGNEVDGVVTPSPNPEHEVTHSQDFSNMKLQCKVSHSQDLTSVQPLNLAKKRQASVSTKMRGNSRIKSSFVRKNTDKFDNCVHVSNNLVNKKVEKDVPTACIPVDSNTESESGVDSLSFSRVATVAESKVRVKHSKEQEELICNLEEKESYSSEKTKVKSRLNVKTPTDSAEQNCGLIENFHVSQENEVSHEDKFKCPTGVSMQRNKEKQLSSESCKPQMRNYNPTVLRNKNPSPLLSLQPKPTPNFVESLQHVELFSPEQDKSSSGNHPHASALLKRFHDSLVCRKSGTESPVSLCGCSFENNNQGQSCNSNPSVMSDLSPTIDHRTFSTCETKTMRTTGGDGNRKNVDTDCSKKIRSKSISSADSGKEKNEVNSFGKKVSDMNLRESNPDVATYCYAQPDVDPRAVDELEEYSANLDWSDIPEQTSSDSWDLHSNPQVESSCRLAHSYYLETVACNQAKKDGRQFGQQQDIVSVSRQPTRLEKESKITLQTGELHTQYIPTGNKHDCMFDSTGKHNCRSGAICPQNNETFDSNFQQKDKKSAEQVQRERAKRRFQLEIPSDIGRIHHVIGKDHQKKETSSKYDSSSTYFEGCQHQIGLKHSSPETDKMCQSEGLSAGLSHFCFNPVPTSTISTNNTHLLQALSDESDTESCAQSLHSHSNLSGEGHGQPDHMHDIANTIHKRKQSHETGLLQTFEEMHNSQGVYDHVHEQEIPQQLQEIPEETFCSLTGGAKLHQKCIPLHPGFDRSCWKHCQSKSVGNFVGRQPVCSQHCSCHSQTQNNSSSSQGVSGAPCRDRLDSLTLSDLSSLNAQASSSNDCGDFLSQSDCEELTSHLSHRYASNEFRRRFYSDTFHNESSYPVYSAESSNQLYYPLYPMDPGDPGWDPYYEQWYNTWRAYSMVYYGYAFQESEQNLACSEEYHHQDSSCNSAHYHHQQQQQHCNSRYPSRPPSRLASWTHSCMEESGREEKTGSPPEVESIWYQDTSAESGTKVIKSDEHCGAIRIPSHSIQNISSAQNLLEYVHKQTVQAAGKPDVSFELIVRMENQDRGSAGYPPLENETCTRTDSRAPSKTGQSFNVNTSSRLSPSEELRPVVEGPENSVQNLSRVCRFPPPPELGKPSCWGDYQHKFGKTMVPASVNPYRFCLPPVFSAPRHRCPTATSNNGNEDKRELEHAQYYSGRSISSDRQPYVERREVSTHTESNIHCHDHPPVYHLPPPPPLLLPPPPPPPHHQRSPTAGAHRSDFVETNSCQETSSSEAPLLDSSFDLRGDYDASSSDLDEEDKVPVSGIEKVLKTAAVYSPFSAAQKDYIQENKDSSSEDFDSSSMWQSDTAILKTPKEVTPIRRKSSSLSHFLHQRAIPCVGLGQLRRSCPPAIESVSDASLGSGLSSATKKHTWGKHITNFPHISSHTYASPFHLGGRSKSGDRLQQSEQDFPELGSSPSSVSNFALGSFSHNKSAPQPLLRNLQEDYTCKTFFRKKPFFVSDNSCFSGRNSNNSSGQKMSYSSRFRDRWALGLWGKEAREAFSRPYKSLFVDTHCHLDFLFNREPYAGSFASYRDKNKKTFPSNFEGCVAVFCNPKSFANESRWRPIVDEPRVWMAMGCHPKSAKDYNEWAEMGLRMALKHKKTVALGEIGLDYSRHYGESAALQKEVFIRQIKIALQMKLPLVIHCREAEDDCLQILEEHVPLDYKIHCHCFTSNYESALRWTSRFRNLFIGLTPLVTYKSAVDTHDVARNIPLDKLLLETDAPYFLPCGFDGEGLSMSHPGMALMVAIKVAELRGISVEEVLSQVRTNTSSQKDYIQENKDSSSEDFDSSSMWQSDTAILKTPKEVTPIRRKSSSLSHFLHQRAIPCVGLGQLRRSCPPAIESVSDASLGSGLSSATKKHTWGKHITNFPHISSHTYASPFHLGGRSKSGDRLQRSEQDFPELGSSPSSVSNFALGSFSHNKSAPQPLLRNLQEDYTCKTFFRKKPFLVSDNSCFSGRNSNNSSGQKMSYSSQFRDRWALGLWGKEAREAFSRPYKSLFVDTHCHLDFLFNREPYAGSFASYRDKNKKTFPSNFEGCVAVFCNPKSFANESRWRPIVDEPHVWMAMGCHPKSAKDYNEWAEMGLRMALNHKKTVALGEIGLDYSRHFGETAALQKEVFIRQIKIALEMKLPLVIHCREAEDDCLQILEEHVPLDYKIHCHCFTSNYKSALRWTSRFRNLFIGLTPLVTYQSAVDTHDVARNIPLDKLLLETDAPYFLPCGFHGEGLSLSHPGMALMVAIKVAELRGISVEEVLSQVRTNTSYMYNI